MGNLVDRCHVLSRRVSQVDRLAYSQALMLKQLVIHRLIFSVGIVHGISGFVNPSASSRVLLNRRSSAGAGFLECYIWIDDSCRMSNMK